MAIRSPAKRAIEGDKDCLGELAEARIATIARQKLAHNAPLSPGWNEMKCARRREVLLDATPRPFQKRLQCLSATMAEVVQERCGRVRLSRRARPRPLSGFRVVWASTRSPSNSMSSYVVQHPESGSVRRPAEEIRHHILLPARGPAYLPACSPCLVQSGQSGSFPFLGEKRQPVPVIDKQVDVAGRGGR